MRKLIIEGQNRLKGEIKIQGSKNSILPILVATILCDEECEIYNCPNILDVKTTIEILKYLGCEVVFKNSCIKVNSRNLNKYDIPEKLMRKMRSSIIFLGALISKIEKAELTLPGGCELGPRPIDIHTSGLKMMGINISEKYGKINCYLDKKIKDKKIIFPFPSVGATENLILAAVKYEGTTLIHNAAQEPEIVDLANFLNAMGAKINGAGENIIEIIGVKKLHGAQYTIMSDRIVAITYLCAAGITQSNLILHEVSENHINSAISLLKETGCVIKKYDNQLKIISPERLKPIKNVRTMPYPGFPTDAQALLMAMVSIANGTSVFVETIFESRYKHVSELLRLGAKIKVEGNVAIVDGVKELFGANTAASDLRGAAALIISGLAARGQTIVSGVEYLERGYENINQVLENVGASIFFD
ncbi:MAG: UDP-N-acetylglucosamine 1-carboxyvinyltransferas [Candidatus Improbicoccus pseudotrichonymphae]|uniref:UDP-N-acetylglucosamine 1-carboxyvinyltransferase n=1 Tax=Candidatus Improbicoccus pseudotrichonymphae TaxID=3033792 RepID=A0AA48HYM2_9FIRM|nr:MAG: UDP-N-acetylglucosamine 1-carboxyvinyltransferas [Candidatus Improbicoccus pseudotrichonymphae]